MTMHRPKTVAQARRIRWQERRQWLDESSPGPPLRLVTTRVRPRFWLTVTREPTNATMWLYGELDLAAEDQVLSAASAQISIGRPAAIAVDLGGLAFLSVSGITTLMTVQQLAAEHRIAFALHNVPPRVQRVFSVCDVTDSFTTTAQPGPRTAVS